MVSLTRSMNTSSGGATFFSESINHDDNRRLINEESPFTPLKTVPAFSTQLIASLTLEIVAIVLAVVHPDDVHKCESFFIVLYMHIGLWVISLIVDLYARKQHHNLKLAGHLVFNNRIKKHHRLPLYVVSLWNAAFMLMQTLLQHFYPDNFADYCMKSGLLSPINFLCVSVSLEVCIIAGINYKYISEVVKFNREKPMSDVDKTVREFYSKNPNSERAAVIDHFEIAGEQYRRATAMRRVLGRAALDLCYK